MSDRLGDRSSYEPRHGGTRRAGNSISSQAEKAGRHRLDPAMRRLGSLGTISHSRPGSPMRQAAGVGFRVVCAGVGESSAFLIGP
jgi:hypothetical protein